MDEVVIYTDGACRGNPGPGGNGVILSYKGIKKELSGGFENTTNNRMELTAAIEGLSALNRVCSVTLVTDSKYVADGLSLGWAESWQKNGWRKSDKKPALNSDLWEKLLFLYNKHKVNIKWIKGQNGHKENERCDALAVAAYQKYLK